MLLNYSCQNSWQRIKRTKTALLSAVIRPSTFFQNEKLALTKLSYRGLLFLFLFFLNYYSLFAQNNPAPPGIPFQGYIRDLAGMPAKNKEIIVIATILETSPSGTVTLKEQFKPTTNADGVFTIILGQGILLGGTPGDLSKIDWTKKLYYLNIQTAVPTSVTMPPNWDYMPFLKDMGTSQFWSVPYALNAGTSAATAIAGAKALSGDKFLKVNGGDSAILRAASLSLNTDSLYNYIGKGILKDTSNNLRSLIATKLNSSDTLAMLNPYLRKSDTFSLSNRINTKLNSSDTLAMLNPYLRKSDTISLSNRINTKLNSSDTLVMLNPYLRKLDTASLSNRINTKLNSSDTLAMLNPYLRKLDTASLSNRINTKLSISDTLTMLNPYLRKIDTASLSNRINTKLSISDTLTMLNPYLRKLDTVSLSNRINAQWNTKGNAATTATDFIGTTDAQPLMIKTNNTNALTITPDQKLGIGTSSPNNTLEINSGKSDTAGLRFTTLTTASKYTDSTTQKFLSVDNAGNVILAKISSVGGTPFYAQGGNNDAGSNKDTAIWRNGNIGIGTGNIPKAKLEIKGDTTSSGLRLSNLSNQLETQSYVGYKDTVSWATTGENPLGIAIDGAGNIYTPNYGGHTITKITPAGIATIIDISAVGQNPIAIAADAANNIFIANWGNSTVTKITSTGVVSNFASLPVGSFLSFITLDASGNVYLGDESNKLIKLDQNGTLIFSVDLPLNANPSGIVIGGDGSIYTANKGRNSITKFTSTGQPTVPSPFATTGTSPKGLVKDAAGNLYTANSGGTTISKIAPDGTTTDIEVGEMGPASIAIDGQGNLYTGVWTEMSGNKVLKIVPNGTISELGSTGNNPVGIVLDASGNIYTSNAYSNTVTKIAVSNDQQSYIASQFLTVNSNGDVVLANASSGTGLPTQSGNVGKVLTTNGTTASWQTPAASDSSQLQKITENGQTGWRILGRDPANYGDIGDNAIDLSYNNAASTTKGATGLYAIALGYQTTASGNYSTAMGLRTTPSGGGSTAMGGGTIASGSYSTAMGIYTNASGAYSTAMGLHSTAKSYGELSIGVYNDTLSAVNATAFAADSNRLFTVGSGTDTNARKTAFVIQQNGNVGINTRRPNTKLEINSGYPDSAGMRFTTLTAASKYTDSTTKKFLSVDSSGNVILAKIIQPSTAHYIGEEFGGGVIFHLWKDKSGIEHGLIVALINQSNSHPWSNLTTSEIGTSAKSPWDGLSNSNAIVAQSGHTSSAAKLCIDLVSGGYDDWYLPAIQELQMLWNNSYTVNKALSEIPGASPFTVASLYYYWSSTELNNNLAMTRDFDTGNTATRNKSMSNYVRAIRAF